MESKAADPEPEAVARELLAGPKAGRKAAPKAVANMKTAMKLMAAARKKKRAKPAAGVAKPLPAPKRKSSMFEPPSIDEIQVPDGVSPAMRAAYVFAAPLGHRNPLAGSGVRSREDLVHHFETLDQKKQEEIERKKRKAARIRAEGAKEQAKHEARMAELAERKKKLEAHMNEEVRKEDERKKKQKRDAA